VHLAGHHGGARYSRSLHQHPLAHRRIQTIQFGEVLAGGLGPDERSGIIVVLGDVAVDGSLEVDDRVGRRRFLQFGRL
jgi:hypothetical protein